MSTVRRQAGGMFNNVEWYTPGDGQALFLAVIGYNFAYTANPFSCILAVCIQIVYARMNSPSSFYANGYNQLVTCMPWSVSRSSVCPRHLHDIARRACTFFRGSSLPLPGHVFLLKGSFCGRSWKKGSKSL